MKPIISLHGISKSYRHLKALNAVDLEIPTGITGLLGPNGAGKSTLIKVILGLVKVNLGSGTVLGLDLNRHGREIRSRIGYMPEDDCYIPGMTGIEVVQFAAVLSGLPGVEALRRSHEILDFCGMKQERYRQIETYSTGMRQKIKFAAAIVHDPELLIFDEPTSGLDPEERESLLNRIRILADDSDKSVLISTHILPDVQSICDHAVILTLGRIVLNESLSTINQLASPAISIRIDGNEDRFVQSLHRCGVSADQNVDRSWRVSSERNDVAQLVWETAGQSGTTILAMEPARNDLESIFLRAVMESNHAST